MEKYFLLYIAIIGMLAFFEPCTIATHTLFAMHTSMKIKTDKIKELTLFVVSRLLLISLLLSLCVVIIHKQQWDIISPKMIFFVLAILYLASRYSYIPIPHLDFSKLLPQRIKENYAIQLGFTLPACIIPIFLITIGFNITVHTLMFTLLSSLIFTTTFSFPTVIIVYSGITGKTKMLLSTSAKVTPFITSFLFLISSFVF